ncbi:MAG: hypothetical protein E7408_00550 [Ruminococcaceae bacterium]|nr:hypothetical protein [Oscillospiraceae bacterium]
MQYVILVISAVLLAVDFSLNKIYQRLKGTSPAAGFGFNSLLGLFTAIMFFGVNGFKTDFSIYSFIMAALVNLFMLCYNIIGFKLLKSGTMAMYTLFLMSGGMTVPYIFGLLFLDEPFSLLRTTALVLILISIVLSNIRTAKVNSKQITMCIAVFVLNGFVSVFSKLHQIELNFDTINVIEFVLAGGIFKFTFAGILYLFTRKHTQEKADKKLSIMSLVIIITSAAVGGFSYLMQLWGATSLPATVLYPFVTGGSIVAASIAGVIFFKERLSKNLIVSIVLCVAGTIMFL